MVETMFAMEDLLQAVVTGVLAGGVYGLMCVGLGLIFGVMRVINFAQGDFLMLGMYAALFLLSSSAASTLGGSEWAPFLMALLAGPLLFAAGYAIHRFLCARVTHVPSSCCC